MENEIKEIVEEIFREAQKGIVEIGDPEKGPWKFYVRFYTKIEGKLTAKNFKYPVLDIPDYSFLIYQLEKYLEVAEKFYKNDQQYYNLEEKDFKKKLLLDLFINVGYYDLTNFSQYIETRISMLDRKLKTGSFLLGKYENLNIFVEISKNRSNLESPYKFDIYFKDEKQNQFRLPTIMFAIANDKCFVMAIQNLNKEKENELSKKLNRYFRKVNKGIENEEIIGNISPNALVSFTLFVSYLENFNTKEIIAPCFLPLRYHANKIAGYNRSKNTEERHQFLEKHNYNQHNMTEKFLYLFLRYQHHFEYTDTYFNIAKQQMKMILSKSKTTPQTDNIIYSLSNTAKSPENIVGKEIVNPKPLIK